GFFVAHAGGDARVGAAAVLGRAGEIEVAQVAGEKVDVAERVGEAGQHAVVGVVLVEDRGRAAALRPATDEAVPTPREDGGGVDGQAGPARAFGEFDGGAAEAGDPPDVEVVRDVGIFGHGEVDVVVVHGDAGGAGLGACERHRRRRARRGRGAARAAAAATAGHAPAAASAAGHATATTGRSAATSG